MSEQGKTLISELEEAPVEEEDKTVFEWLKKKRNHEKKYEIIFADAPFETEENKYNEMIDLVLNNELLKPNGIFILEHQSRIKFTHPNLKDTRKYGNVSFSFFQSEPISK